MDQVLAALTRHKTRARRKAVGVGAGISGTLGVVALAAWLPTVTGPARMCRTTPPGLAQVWAPARQETVQTAFQSTGMASASDTFARVSAVLSGYLDQWRSMYKDTCEATHVRGDQSQALMDVRMACLNRRLGEANALVRVLEGADAAVTGRALIAAHGLSPLDVCADSESLLRAEPPPTDEASQAALARIDETLSQAKASYDAAQYESGAPVARKALDQARTLGYAPRIADAAAMLARYQMRLDQTADTAPLVTEALLAAERSGDDRARLSAYLKASEAATTLDQYSEARAALDHAKAIASRLGQGAGAMVEILYQEALVGLDTGQTPAARDAIGQCIALLRSDLPDDEVTLLHALNIEGLVLERMGLHDQAVASLTEGMTIAQRVLGPEHPKMMMFHTNLGMAYRQMGQYEKAETHSRTGLRISQATRGPDHSSTAQAWSTLGSTLFDQRKFAEAKTCYLKALALHEKVYGSRHTNVAVATHNMALTTKAMGDVDEALVWGTRTLELSRELRGMDHPRTAHVLQMMGSIHLAAGDLKSALHALSQSLAITQKAHGPDSPTLIEALRFKAAVLIYMGRPGEAVPLVEKGLAIMAKHPDQPRHHAWMEFTAARAIAGAGGDIDRARSLGQKAQTRFKELGPRYAEDRAQVQQWLATLPTS
jgi:tetratricopeptide (TPR) repeat protein